MTTATTPEDSASPPVLTEPTTTERPRSGRRRSLLIWTAVAVSVVVISVVWILATDLRPSYDPFGWLDWGQQVLAGNFNTIGAPSWKPLTFLFTMPFALAGRNPQMFLWIVTSTASGLAGCVFAGRIAYHLAGPMPARPWARWAGAGFAGIGILGMTGYSQLLMIANSDPMIITLCLAAVDCALHRRHRLAFLALFLASLGRPEVWPFVVLYTIWAVVKEPRLRWWALLGCILIPASWFIVSGLTSTSWLHEGDLALGSSRIIHGSKFIGVFGRLRRLFAVPVQLTIVFALGLAIFKRERQWLWVAGAALLWVLIEIAFALHGWSAVIRYLTEPGALLLTLAGAAIARVLAWVPPVPRYLRLAPVIPIIALLVALIPGAHFRYIVIRYEIKVDQKAMFELNRLERVIRNEGGAARMKACGQPATFLGYQSELAWALGTNVATVSFRPGNSIHKGRPVVEFKPHEDGWQIRVFNIKPALRKQCDSLHRDSNFGGPNPAPSKILRVSGG